MIKETTYCKRSVSIFAKQGKKRKKMNVNKQNTEKAELSQQEGKKKTKSSQKTRQLIPATSYKQSVRDTFTDEENAGSDLYTRASRQVLNFIADMLYAASDVFKRAVDAIIHYGTEKYKSLFGNNEAADIKNVMGAYEKTKEQYRSVGTWLCNYAEGKQPFDKMKHQQTYKEVADIANGAYDWKIKRGKKLCQLVIQRM